MKGKRVDRVGHLVQMELSQLVLHKVKDPRIGFVTITHVDISHDFRNARVFYSVMGDEKKKKDTQLVLEKAAGFLQKEISASIVLRNTPRLHFVLDDSLDRSFEIDKVLRVIHKEEESSPKPES